MPILLGEAIAGEVLRLLEPEAPGKTPQSFWDKRRHYVTSHRTGPLMTAAPEA